MTTSKNLDEGVAMNAIQIRSGRPINQGDAEAELAHLRELIESYFPAEAAGANTADPEELLRLAKGLLERLWRWEH